MTDKLSAQQRSELKTKLQDRLSELQEEIQRELRESNDRHYIDLAGKVHDLEEESLADLLVDLDHAIADLHIEEIRGIENALMRFSQETYGICIDCGVDIDYQRLRANPAAARCLNCQAKHEKTRVGQHPPPYRSAYWLRFSRWKAARL